MTVSTFLQNSLAELRSSLDNNKHPFRVATLATRDAKNIKQRSVIHRAFINEHQSIIYSDYSTKKINDISKNPEVSILFYDDTKNLQISVQASAKIHLEGPIWTRHHEKIRNFQLRDYNTEPSPGTVIKAANDFKNEENRFCVVILDWYTIDILQLDRAGHQRAIFEYDNSSWSGQWVVP